MPQNFNQNGNVNTTTLEKLMAKTVDTIINYSPLNLRILGNQGSWNGSRMKFPIKYAKNTSGKSFSSMSTKFNTEKQNNFINMEFDPVGREMPVVIDQFEADVNKSNPTIDMIKRQLATDSEDMCDDISDLLYGAQSGDNFLGLVDACDAGANVATYGGLSRAVYTGIQGNYTASVGTITLDLLSAKIDDCTHGTEMPDLIVTTKTVWSYIEKLLKPSLQTNYNSQGYAKMTRTDIVPPTQGLRGEAGFNCIFYRGIPIVADEKCTAGYIYFLNTKYLKFYGLKSSDPDYTPISFGGPELESVYSDAPKTTGFHWSGFMKPIDQYGKIGHIILLGNFICRSPRHQGVMRGITGV